MKKIYFFLSIAFLCLTASLKAQTINIRTATDSLGFYCIPNAQIGFIASTDLTGYTVGDSVTYEVNFGDGNTKSKKSAIWSSFPPGAQSSWIHIQHNYTLPGSYNVRTIAIAPDGKRDTFFSPNPIVVSVCGNIKGKAYMDKNNDCTFNTGDDNLKHVMVAAKNNTTSTIYYAATDVNGDYEFNVPVGATYTVSLGSTQFTASCPAGGHPAASIPSTGIDMGVQCGTGFDLFGSIHGQGFRPARLTAFSVKAYNSTCNPTSGTVKVVLNDARIQYGGAYGSATPPTVTGDTLEWSFSNLDYTSLSNFHTNLFYFYALTDTNAVLGDSICMEIIVEPSAGDNDPANNSTTYCFPISNSYDPNEKQAQPLGIGENNIISPGTVLDYTIYFQNTGNDVAYDVFILDTIEDNFHMPSLKVMGASHPMDWEIFEGNILRFNFPNINLPDSTSNEPESHGFVSFSIEHKSGLPLGTELKNRVGIYFDFNEPIITNTVVRTIDVIQGLEGNAIEGDFFNIYPNPTKGSVTVEMLEETSGRLIVRSLVGQTISNHRLNAGNNIIDLSGYQKGIYLMEVETAAGKVQIQRIIVQ